MIKTTRLRLISFILTAVMVIGFLPVQLYAVPDEYGQVRVIIENNTANESNTTSWTEGTEPWNGVLLDEQVDLIAGDTPITVAKRAAEANGIEMIADSVVKEIAGLKNDNTSSAGWMGTLNDWFTNTGLGNYTLEDGDVVCLTYSLTGADAGGSYLNNNKTLMSLDLSSGTLIPAFASGNYSYQLELGEGVTSASLSVNPTANNKYFQVRTYKGDTYSASDAGYKRSALIPVRAGDTLTVVVGDTAWPSMNNGAYGGADTVAPGIYTITVVETAEEPENGFDSFFTALDGIATVANNTNYPWIVDAGALCSTNGGTDYSESPILLTFSKAAELSFYYKASSEKGFDFLKITKNGVDQNADYTAKKDFSGDMAGFVQYTITANAGDSIKLSYSKDSSGNKFDDRIYLKDFTVSLPKTITYYANDGTDTSTEQAIFGALTLRANPFTRAGYRFDGWSLTPDGEVAYTDGERAEFDANTALYAVWTKLWTVRFPNMPEGVSLTVTSNGTIQNPKADGSWELPDGVYTYHASKFGYETANDVEFIVDGANLMVSDELVESEKYTLSFAVDPSDATIIVKNAEGTEMSAQGSAYLLPAGTYSYMVKASGYRSVSGTFTAENRVITLTLEPTAVWDGETRLEPSLIDGVYQIASGEELAWFSAQVNAGNSDLDAVLTGDIELGDAETVRVWTPIGTQSQPYTGSFDGNGHTIAYLHATGVSYIGLFGNVGANGIVAQVTLSEVTVSGKQSVGAIAGANAGQLIACAVESGTVTQDTSADAGIGGIAGLNSGVIAYCFNQASIVRGHGQNNYGYLGGIAGDNSGTIESSYNLGSVDRAYYVGGIAGRSYGKLFNAYNAGAIAYNSTNNKAIAGNTSTNSVISGCYFLDTCGTVDPKATAKTADDFKTLAASLGGAYSNGTSFPILKWQDPTASYTITLTVTPDDASVTLMNGETPVEAASVADGVHTYTVTKGRYTYMVSSDAGDYAPQSGELTLGYSDITKDIALEIRRYEVVFNLTPSDAMLTVQQGETVVAGDDGVYSLANGVYTYTAEAFGYESVSGEITVDGSALVEDVALTALAGGDITFDIEADGGFDGKVPVITVVHTETGREFSFHNHEAKFLPDGVYTYTVKMPTYGTLEGTITIAGEAQTLTGTLYYSDAWDGVTSLEPAMAAGVYQISNGYELAWYRDTVNATLYGSYTTGAVLTADIDLGGQEWTPIWKFVGTSEAKGYNAVFDGAGYTITGLAIDTDVKGAGLFGYVYKNGVIKNLTVEGSVKGSQYVSGIVAVLAGGRIENCTNRATVSTSLKSSNAFLGGITGYMANYTDKTAYVVGCTNTASILGGTNGYIGGIVGNSAYGPGVENCLNSGSVSGADDVAGISGNGTIPIKNCVNTGSIYGKDSIGGIAGFVNSVVTDCINTGYISGIGVKYGVGGIVGRLHSEYGAVVNGSFNSGAVHATGEFCGAIVGYKNGDTVAVLRSYYLEGTAEIGIGSFASAGETAIAVSASDVPSMRFVAKLGGGFRYDAAAERPVLRCENAESVAVTAFDVTPTDAVVTVTGTAGVVQPVEPGVYFLADGEYSYTVEKEKFNPGSGNITVSSQSATVEVVLENETFPVRFDVTPADAVITISNGEGVIATGAHSDFTQYDLENGTYSYTVEKFGYESVSDSFTVADASVEIPAIVLAVSPRYNVDFTPDFGEGSPAYTLTIQCDDAIVATLDSIGSVTLPDGMYTFTVVALGYFDYEGAFTVDGTAVDLNFTVQLRTTWDGTSREEPAKIGEVYQITCAEELVWFANAVSSGNVNLNAVLLTDIHINDEFSSNVWSPIGNYSNQYKGTFDGAGHTINGLTAALFGYNGAGSLVKNVTVTGSVSGSSNVGAICNASYGSFENCVNRANVTATGQRVGGIVGILYTGASITNCVNDGAVSSSYTGSEYSSSSLAYLGGIVGYTYGDVTGCVNHGVVSATAVNYGGVGGIAGVADKAVKNCYNTGNVRGYSRTGGIVGVENKVGSSIENCYNIGTVTCTNPSISGMPFCGAIIGTITDEAGNGIATATVTNCYYLTGSFYQKRGAEIHTGGVGYFGNGADRSVAMSAEDMKTVIFALRLGGAFNCADNGQNNGYPVLAWQGGTVPVVDIDQMDVAADLLALTLDRHIIRTADAIILPESGSNGSTIHWTSDNPAVISETGAVVLPDEGSINVTLTATVEKGDASDTKDFVITVYSTASTASDELAELTSSLGSILRPVYGTDENILDLLYNMIATRLENGDFITITDPQDIAITLDSTGNNSGNDTETHIDPDGTLHFFYREPTASGMNMGIVTDVEFTLTASGVNKTLSVQVNLPWDVNRVQTLMAPALETIDFDFIKGMNRDSGHVASALTLPVSPTGYNWITIQWIVDRTDIVLVTPGMSGIRDGIGAVILPDSTSDVKLTAELHFNLTESGEPDIILTKEIPMTVAGAAESRAEQMQTALARYTLDALEEVNSGEPLDPSAVTGDIQLLTPRKLGVDGSVYSLVVTASDEGLVINGYRANSYRPLPGEADHEVTLTATLTHKVTGTTLSKEIGTVTIKALTQAEIDAELLLMQKVKDHLFDGIKNANTYIDHIVSDLSSFSEVYAGADGDLTWVRAYINRTGTGIVPTDLPKEGYDESYNLFHSSDTSAVSHETLFVTRGSQRKDVTITMNLTSQAFARYAERYPKNDALQGLSNQLVSVTVTILGVNEEETDWRDNRDRVLAYIKSSVTAPTISSTAGDWAVLALARANSRWKNDTAWYLYYASELSKHLKETNGLFEDYSDNLRAVFALTALGQDATAYKVNGVVTDLVTPLIAKTEGVYTAATFSHSMLAYALLALDSGAYFPESAVRSEMINVLLDAQLGSGMWNINSTHIAENVDTTAMVLTALAPYADIADDAINAALDRLSMLRGTDGGYGTSEANAQVIIALSALGIDAATDPRFSSGGKNLLTALLSYADVTGGFGHDQWTPAVNQIATEQAALALVAYSRFRNAQPLLFDMSDATALLPDADVRTIVAAIDGLTVSDCKQATYLAIQAIDSLYTQLSADEQAQVVNYTDYLAKIDNFNALLDTYKAAQIRSLNEAFEALDSGNYSSSFWQKLEETFEDGLTAINEAGDAEAANTALQTAVTRLNAQESQLITVTFALIGDTVHGAGGHSAAVSWIPSMSYRLDENATVYDLFMRAIGEHGLDQRGAESNYVSSIKAPVALGGYWLSEYDNGVGSGWVYRVNGSYPDVGLKDKTLRNGDSVVWEYIDNYHTDIPGDWEDDGSADETKNAEAAAPVTTSIGQIGRVKADDAQAVADARKAYDKLTPDQKALVTNYDALVKAEHILNVLSAPLPFTDTVNHWAYDDIRYTYAYGMMNGVGGDIFAPDETLNRSMFVTMLYRLAGEPDTDGTNIFDDVASDSWYAKASAWAYENGIVTGVGDGSFAPDAGITREQIAVILMRYADLLGLSYESAEISAYNDSTAVSTWAGDAIRFAVGSGFMTGRSATELAPCDGATRAEAAVLILRFITNLLDAQ